MIGKDLHNKRMLEFMEYCIYHKVKNKAGRAPENQGEFLTMIGFKYIGNLNQVLKGDRGFTVRHITICCEVFGADANFFFIKKPSAMFIKERKHPVDQLKAIAKLIEVNMGK